MLDIPLNLILISPEIDILIFMIILYFLFKKKLILIIEKKNSKAMWVDIKITAILLILGYLNYSGLKLDVFGLEISWWAYILVAQLIIEIAIFWPYRKKILDSIEKNN